MSGSTHLLGQLFGGFPGRLTGQLVFVLVAPILFTGIVQRTRARWAGRKGPRLSQQLHDLVRLLHKQPVYSATTTGLFQLGPYVALGSTLVASLLVPLVDGQAPLSFRADFVLFAYLWGLGRFFLVLSAMDTGSSFEGMGAAREATYSAFAEPVLFLVLGTLAFASGHASFAAMLAAPHGDGALLGLVPASAAFALLVVLQVESARVPVDDPATHLELTMVHEVMILDHSGPELAAIQYSAALKMTICASIIASVIGRGFAPASLPIRALYHLGLIAVVAVVVGLVESLSARFKLSAVPQYILAAFVAAGTALLASALSSGAAVSG